MDKKNSGFTLIETAIVIGVIGLILTSVLSGAKLYENYRVFLVIKNLNIYSEAMSLFKTKYQSLPGDMTNATSYWDNTQNGDGNGYIGTLYYNTSEQLNAWQHLALSGYIDGKFTGTSISVEPSYGNNMPASSYSQNAMFFLYAGDSWEAFKYSNAIGLTASGTSGAGDDAPVLTLKNVKQIEEKIDDGKPFTGKFISSGASGLSATNGCTTEAMYQFNGIYENVTYLNENLDQLCTGKLIIIDKAWNPI